MSYLNIINFWISLEIINKNYNKNPKYLDINFMSEEPALHCAHCKQEIADKSYAKVGNLAYHVDHFVCGACLTTLAGKKFKSY